MSVDLYINLELFFFFAIKRMHLEAYIRMPGVNPFRYLT